MKKPYTDYYSEATEQELIEIGKRLIKDNPELSSIYQKSDGSINRSAVITFLAQDKLRSITQEVVFD